MARNQAETVSILKQCCNHKAPSLQLHFNLPGSTDAAGASAPWPPPGATWVSEGLIREPPPQEGNMEMEVLLTWERGKWWGAQEVWGSTSLYTLLGFAHRYAQRLSERHGAQ